MLTFNFFVKEKTTKKYCRSLLSKHRTVVLAERGNTDSFPFPTYGYLKNNGTEIRCTKVSRLRQKQALLLLSLNETCGWLFYLQPVDIYKSAT